MGVNNRERRRAKKQKRQRAEAVRGRPHSERDGPTERPGAARAARPFSEASSSSSRGHVDDQAVRDLVLAAAHAFRFQSEAAFARRLEALAALEAVAGRAPVDGAVGWWVERGLDRAWGSGWQPADVVRAVRRTLGAGHADTVAPAVAESAARRAESGTDERWAGQVAALGTAGGRSAHRQPWSVRLALAVQAISVLLNLPPLPRLASSAPAGRGAGHGRSGAVLERVRALLAKAESTTFPEEAEALTAKAQQLMARHAIDEAMLDAASPSASPMVVGWRIGVDDPYAAAKSVVLDRIAGANRGRAVWSKHLGFSTVFATPADLEMIELLFTSLLVQGTDAMVRAGRSVDRSGRSRTRSFRQSFLLAYAIRIGERLAAATEQAVSEGAERHGEALLPVLTGRAGAVDDAVRVAYPEMVERGFAISNYSGWAAGRAAAELAKLGAGDELAAG